MGEADDRIFTNVNTPDDYASISAVIT